MLRDCASDGIAFETTNADERDIGVKAGLKVPSGSLSIPVRYRQFWDKKIRFGDQISGDIPFSYWMGIDIFSHFYPGQSCHPSARP